MLMYKKIYLLIFLKLLMLIVKIIIVNKRVKLRKKLIIKDKIKNLAIEEHYKFHCLKIYYF
jgi:hypothetical protein